MARGADLWGDSGFPFVTLTDYAVDTDSLRNPGAAQLRTFLLAKLFSKFHEGSVFACVGKTPHLRQDQPLRLAHSSAREAAFRRAQWETPNSHSVGFEALVRSAFFDYGSVFAKLSCSD